MNGIKKTTGTISKVFLALVGGILFPILIWVALGVAINQKAREKRARQAATPSFGEILAATAGKEGAK
ncbi:MAG: hypothetical protein Q7R57_05565 [Dehalococcoidales bacterium]|nr:hypothetical protein [Dehalococcoidales bacterium]